MTTTRAVGAPHTVALDDVRAWLTGPHEEKILAGSLSLRALDADYLEDALALPRHITFIQRARAARGEDEGTGDVDEGLASLSFYSLCRGLFLPMSGLAKDRAATIFGLVTDEPLDVAGKEALIEKFLASEIGLSTTVKLSCLLGDPFRGRRALFRRDSFVRVIMGTDMVARRHVLDALARRGDIAILVAESRPRIKEDPPLTAAEVLLTVLHLRRASRADQLALVRDLLARMGKLEAYFFAKLLMRSAGLFVDEQSPVLARALARRFSTEPEAVEHALALTDAFHVVRLLEEHGVDGLRQVVLRPLVAVRPALATTNPIDESRFPVWVERKYDGIRLMVHKATDRRRNVLTGAYTRRRGDWLELIPGMEQSIRALPVGDCILDGELHGTVVDSTGARPATVYEVYALLQGERIVRVNLKYAAFDVLYLNGQDVTDRPLEERRRLLASVVGPVANAPLLVPFALADGQVADRTDDVNRLYAHFRAQGHEGVIAKDLSGRYMLSARDPTWRKKKPEESLDLVLLGGVFAVTTKERAGLFGSYIIGARSTDGGFVDVGDIAGIDRARDQELQHEIMREGLLTGRRIERASVTGVRPGVELRPHVVVSVRYSGVVKDHATGRFSLRDPRLAFVRSDKGAHEVDTTSALEEAYIRQRVA